ncbi:MAG TPA: histidine kinase [Burkholderiaceae bacterium]
MDNGHPTSIAELRSMWQAWLSGTSPVQPPLWVQFAWTVAFSAVVAFGFTVLFFIANADTIAKWLDLGEWARWYGRNLVVSLTVGVVIAILFRVAFAMFGARRLNGLAGWRRTAFFSGVPLLGTAIGWPIGMTLIFGEQRLFHGMTSGNVVATVVLAIVISLGFQTYFSLRTRGIRAEMAASEAQLRLLQGQMEPHFLFNTLANVICMIDTDAPRAKHTLEALTDYLRASLGSLRVDDSTLGAELDLAGRYLELMQARMGERLRFELQADDALRHAALMPLVLQPLIENAVKHGLEPQVDGGTVRVKAARLPVDGHDSLQVCVEDDGAGLAAAASRPRRRVAGGADGNGIALANLRERLRSRFGPAAQLTLSELEDGHGTRACLVIPWLDARAPA